MQVLRKWQADKAWRIRCEQDVSPPQHPCTWGKGAKLLVLVQEADAGAVSAAQAFAKTCQQKQMQVEQLSYSTQKRGKEEEPIPNVWTPAELAFNKLPRPEAEAHWQQQAYDVVIHCSLSAFAPFDYLTAGLRAHRKIAAYDSVLCAYNLVIKPKAGEAIAEFLRQTVHYLDILTPSYAKSNV